MKLLAIDTATEACSVALWDRGRLFTRFQIAGRDHSVRLPSMVAELVAESGIALSGVDGLIACVGPGSFAGVRIGVAFTKGLALGMDRPAVGVSSLAMLAQGAFRTLGATRSLAAIDARMNEVYVGEFRIVEGCASALAPEVVSAAADVHVSLRNFDRIAGIGTGWGVAERALSMAVGRMPDWVCADALPDAQDAVTLSLPIFQAGAAQNATHLVPNYLRDRVALTQVEQIAARARRLATEGPG